MLCNMRFATRALGSTQVCVTADGVTAARTARTRKWLIHGPFRGVVIKCQLFMCFNAAQRTQCSTVDPTVRCTTVVEESPAAPRQVIGS